MKLVVISGFWPTEANSIGGIFVVQQVEALLAKGCDITVIVAKTKGRANSNYLTLHELGIKSKKVRFVETSVFRVPEKLSAMPGGVLFNVKSVGLAIRKILRVLSGRGVNFDGCIIHGIRYLGLSLPMWRFLIKGKVLMVMHGEDPFMSKPQNVTKIKPILKAAVLEAHKMILVGRPLLKVTDYMEVDDTKISIVSNGTHIPPLRELEAQSQRDFKSEDNKKGVNVISISNLTKIKGVDLNLKALSDIYSLHPNLLWNYEIIGDGPELESLENLASKLGIADRVKFCGRISYSETMSKLSQADIFSLPSWGEAFGIVYLEAMARMKPVIGCYENGAADIITNGKDGLLVSPQDVDSLRDALLSLFQNYDYANALGVAGRKTAESYTWAHNATKVLDIVSED